MKTIDIYINYGVLTREKRNVYTYGGQHPNAVCSNKITVTIPKGWEIYQNTAGQTMATAPWGWDYGINDVLQGDEYPHFMAYDKNMVLHVYRLEEA